MRMYIPLTLLLMFLTCRAAQDMRFIYKDKVIRMTPAHIQFIMSLQFNKRNSIIEFAFIENFMVIRISPTTYKLMDVPLIRQDRLHLLLEEEAKVDDDINKI
jgi:hypothetical protein